MTGEVIATDTRISDEEERHFLIYEYEFHGVTYTIRDRASAWRFERYPVGSVDEFYIHREHPQQIKHVLGTDFIGARLLQIGATLCWLPTLFGFGRAAIRAAGVVNVRRFGDRVPAEIVAIEPVWAERNSARPSCHIVWKTEAGRFGQSFPVHARWLKAFEVGARIWVYAGPDRDWWEGDVGARAEHQSDLPRVSDA